MSFGLNTLGRFLRSFRKDDDGGPTVEFAIVFMPFMILMVSAFELGMLMTRHVMLERGLDMAVREVRINTGAQITEDQFKAMICNAANILPDCTEQLHLEMKAVELRSSNALAIANIRFAATCEEITDPYLEADRFKNGVANQMMVVRACARLQPVLPKMALGWFLSKMDTGYYRLVSISAFVMEPV